MSNNEFKVGDFVKFKGQNPRGYQINKIMQDRAYIILAETKIGGTWENINNLRMWALRNKEESDKDKYIIAEIENPNGLPLRYYTGLDFDIDFQESKLYTHKGANRVLSKLEGEWGRFLTVMKFSEMTQYVADQKNEKLGVMNAELSKLNKTLNDNLDLIEEANREIVELRAKIKVLSQELERL